MLYGAEQPIVATKHLWQLLNCRVDYQQSSAGVRRCSMKWMFILVGMFVCMYSVHINMQYVLMFEAINISEMHEISGNY